MSGIGTIELVELPAIEAHQHHAAEQISERLLYRWSPPTDLVQKLPPDYSVVLECWRGLDGVRRFSPANPKLTDFTGYTSYDLTAFALEASVGGHALLWRRGESAPDPWLPYGVARLFMQYAHHLREHLGPTRKLKSALHVCAAARITRGEIDALPGDIGLNAKGEGERWSAGRLMEEGRLAAKQRGMNSATEDDIVRLGLLAAADLNPLNMSDAESEFVTRAVIFRMNSDQPGPSDELLTFVAMKISDSIDKKQYVSNEEFRMWIEDPKSNLLRSIHRARKKLERTEISGALLELAWRSIKMFGKSVDALMRDIREAMPEELTPTENLLYEQMYLSNPMLGGLPLILIHDRWPLLREVIPDLWNAPEETRSVAKVRTMLYFYGVIVGNLRDSDMLYKRRANSRNGGKCAAREEALSEHATAASATAMSEILHDVIRKLAVERGLICAKYADDWKIRIVCSDDATVMAELSSQAGEEVIPLVVDRDIFDQLVKTASSS